MNDQEQAFEKLSRLKVGALFMKMGTGKTKVALDLIASKENKVDYVLWICPCSLKNEILKEKAKWQPDLVIDVVGCESIGSSDRIYIETLNKVQAASSPFIIVDESLKIKNYSAKRTRRILDFSQYAKYKLILNGTPMSKTVLDIYTQMDFLSPKILDTSYREFKERYCEFYTRGKMKGRVRSSVNIPHLISIIEPYIFDAELNIDVKRYYDYYSYHTDLYEYEEEKNRLFDEYYDAYDDDINFNAFAIKLQRWYITNSDRQKVMDDLIEDIDDSAIVFVKYLDGIPKDAHKIIGDITQEERAQIINDFEQGKFKTLYITYGCGAFGLNLQFCHNTIFADKVWDFALVEQAEARTFRIGQKHEVNYYNLCCQGIGLEKLFDRCIDRKSGLLDTMQEEIQKTKGGIKEWVKRI